MRRRGGQPRPAPMQGRPPTAKPAATKAPCTGAAYHDQNSLAGAVTTRRGRPQACLATAGVGSARGQAAGGDCLLQGRKGQPRGAATHADSVQHRCLRRGKDDDYAEEGKEMARTSF
ncbi:hypothetical protein B296_00022080 [Ensete ventricosum]|uniref:Uncharacterized protein n=1 Tax=Ensete ventricosum TaxID=4639 RepID=A0A426YXF7_ENSVE|nr:hypothetical protein B296_00022080 [Ensete ventricosum]